jgi:hypothetical protein
MRLRAAGLGRTVDVLASGSRESTNRRLPQKLGYFEDGFEIAVRGDGEACFDHVDAKRLKSLGNAQLFVQMH